MSSEFPRLQKHLEEIRIKIDEMLKNDFIDKNLIEEVELELKPEFFISRSYQADAVIKLREILIKLPKISSSNTRKIDSEKIQKQHIYAAQSLLQMSRCEKLAIEVLIAGLSSTNPDVPDLASKALGKVKKHLDSHDNSNYLGSRPPTKEELAQFNPSSVRT